MWIALAYSYLLTANAPHPWSCDYFTRRLAGVCDFSPSNPDLCGGARKTGNVLDSLGRSTLNQNFGKRFVYLILISLNHDSMSPNVTIIFYNALEI